MTSNKDPHNRVTNKKVTHKRVIGITGNSGSGKTTVANILAAKGATAIEADKVAHKAFEKGTPTYKKIISAFGPGILGQDEEISRKKLGALVFSDTKKRTQLESIVHPFVTEEILKIIEESHSSLIVIDAVLLVEAGLNKHCDIVWLVRADENLRLKRITTRDNLDKQAAEARMRNQRDTQHIPAISQGIIENDGDMAALNSQIEQLLKQLC